MRSEKGARLNRALGSATESEYHYDFGDDWQHRVIVESSSGGQAFSPARQASRASAMSE
ncbi:IS1096 element passenger TnpR family protein [Cupriavidus sp. YAF13]|uniref:IS1096 element passenger TnpR family protein n=1 Tax=Cupriavidus sp. YAF13 TaxID=3233075 RepID=UPI003F93AB08